MTKLMFPAALAAAAAVAAPALAHHSAAMFDRTRVMTLEGSYITQAYTNPHVWISVMAKADGKGAAGRWDVETVSPANLTRIGINKDTLKPGEKVIVKINPLRDGRRGGALMSITTADGKLHGFREGDPGGVAPPPAAGE